MEKNKKVKIVPVKEGKLVDLIDKIVEATIRERNLVPAPKKVAPKSKKMTVTESQLRDLQKKGVKIDSIKKKS